MSRITWDKLFNTTSADSFLRWKKSASPSSPSLYIVVDSVFPDGKGLALEPLQVVYAGFRCAFHGPAGEVIVKSEEKTEKGDAFIISRPRQPPFLKTDRVFAQKSTSID